MSTEHEDIVPEELRKTIAEIDEAASRLQALCRSYDDAVSKLAQDRIKNHDCWSFVVTADREADPTYLKQSLTRAANSAARRARALAKLDAEDLQALGIRVHSASGEARHPFPPHQPI